MTKEQQRLINFLEEDIIKLEKDVNVLTDMLTKYLHYSDTQKPLENIDTFFSYWTRHINKLKTN